MPLLHEATARRHFPKIVEDLTEAAPAHASTWRIEQAGFPYIAVHILNTDGDPLIGILIDGRDWPHRPLSFVPMNLRFSKRLSIEQIPRKPDPNEQHHIVARQGDPWPWFCIIGTAEYHDHYKQHLPWESIRHLPTNKPHAVLNACTDCIDRTAKPGQGQIPP